MIDTNNTYGTRDRQIDLLNMMREVDLLLNRHGIKYSLCGGTLLGAVRDKGFIPWDDDIDIMVDRENFNKLLSSFRSEDETEYSLNDYLWVRKIQLKGNSKEPVFGPTIDVFVVDKCPNNKLLQIGKVFLIKMLQGMMKKDETIGDISLISRLCLVVTRVLGKLFSDNKKLRWYDRVSQIGHKNKSTHVGIYNDLYRYLDLKYCRKMMDECIDATFEDMVLPITAEYDDYLRTVYGDYMTPPPVENRKPIHLLAEESR